MSTPILTTLPESAGPDGTADRSHLIAQLAEFSNLQIANSTGTLQLGYSNGTSASGPKLAFVTPQTESTTAIALDFSNTTSMKGEDTS